MTTLDKMWTALESHQPIADRLGYGEAWAIMCKKKTFNASFDASVSAAKYCKKASDASFFASVSTFYSEPDHRVIQSIKRIEKANKELA